MLALSVVSPERAFLEEQCLSVTLPGLMGELQVLPGHEPCLIRLQAGIITLETGKHETKTFMIAQGFVEIDKDRVNVLCEKARHKTEIDVDLEKKTIESLKDEIARGDAHEEKLAQLNAELESSVATLKLFE
jgi:F-type H+-transporting ATPase subunit epsilon